MPSTWDVINIVLAVLSLVSLRGLFKLFASRLPPGRLKTINTELADMQNLLVNLERERYPHGAAMLHQFTSRLKQFNGRAANLSLDVSRWKDKGLLGRYVHWAEWSELLHICKELQDGLANMRVHLHQLPPPYYTSAYADYYVQATPSDILRDTAAYTDDVQATSPYTDDVLEKPSDGSSDTASPAYVDRDVQVIPSETSSDAVSYRDEEQVPVILIDVDVSSGTTANADDVHETLSNASPDTAVAASSSSSTPTLVSSDTYNGQATPDTALSSSPTTPDVSDTLAYANDVQITLANASSDTAASSSSTATLVESSTSAPSSPPKTSSPPLPAPAPAQITEPAAVHDKVDVVPRTPSPVLEAPEQVMRETIPAGQSHTSALQAHPEQSSITSRHGHTARDDSDYDTDSEDSLEGYGSEVVGSFLMPVGSVPSDLVGVHWRKPKHKRRPRNAKKNS